MREDPLISVVKMYRERNDKLEIYVEYILAHLNVGSAASILLKAVLDIPK